MDSLPESVLFRLRSFQDFTSDRNCLAVCSQWKVAFSTPDRGRYGFHRETLGTTFPGTVTMADINRFPPNFHLISLLAATIRHLHIQQDRFNQLVTPQSPNNLYIHDILRRFLLTGLRFPKLTSLTISFVKIREAKALRDFVPRLKLTAPNLEDLKIKALPRQNWIGFFEASPWAVISELDIFLEEYKVDSDNNDEEMKRAYVKQVKDIVQEIQDAFTRTKKHFKTHSKSEIYDELFPSRITPLRQPITGEQCFQCQNADQPLLFKRWQHRFCSACAADQDHCKNSLS